jgi:cell wall assembly regulator SMI1
MTELDAAIARGAREGVQFRGPASPAEIAELERRLEHRLPEDLHAFYSRHDGAIGIGVVSHEDLLSVANAKDEWANLCEVWRELDPQPGLWSDAWLPITSDGGGSFLCIDLADNTGAVIRYLHADPNRPRIAKSFSKWLATVEWTVDVDE